METLNAGIIGISFQINLILQTILKNVYNCTLEAINKHRTSKVFCRYKFTAILIDNSSLKESEISYSIADNCDSKAIGNSIFPEENQLSIQIKKYIEQGRFLFHSKTVQPN